MMRAITTPAIKSFDMMDIDFYMHEIGCHSEKRKKKKKDDSRVW